MTMTMRLFLLASAATLLAVAPGAAYAACLGDGEIEAQLGQQIRSGAVTLDTGPLVGRPLCSGLTLAQRIQQMHDAAFPREQAQRDQLAAEARSRDVQAQEAASRARAMAPPPMPMAAPAVAVIPRPAPPPPANRPLVVTTAALGISLDTLLDRLVHADSASWMSNKYVVGSMHNARYVTTNKAHTSYVAYGEYGFHGFGGGNGWVKVKVTNGNLDCLEFWDQAGQCRPLYRSLSQQMLVAGMVGMMSGGGSGNGGNSTSSQQRDPDVYRQDNGSPPPPPPPPPPVTPIGGDRGLYGSDHSCCGT
jgi:hypothetical protein